MTPWRASVLGFRWRIAVVGASMAVAGCTTALMSPAGPVGDAERTIFLDSLAIMLIIVVPTILATLWFAYRYRSSNGGAKHLPTWSYSGRLELIVWSIPALVILFLGGIAWLGSHELDPARPLASSHPPLDIQVVSLDWKWLFIYPAQGIASINRIVAPVGVPLHFEITSASVMNVFFVPRLGSEIYSMYGMATQLNLQADRPGIYPGLSAHFSGDGFSGMSFELQAVAPAQFDSWVASSRAARSALDDREYRALLRQTQDVAPLTYRAVRDGLFHDIVMKKLPPGQGPTNLAANPASPTAAQH
jgi:cytochrome o ubiquinol oxidase subunit 2